MEQKIREDLLHLETVVIIVFKAFGGWAGTIQGRRLRVDVQRRAIGRSTEMTYRRSRRRHGKRGSHRIIIPIVKGWRRWRRWWALLMDRYVGGRCIQTNVHGIGTGLKTILVNVSCSAYSFPLTYQRRMPRHHVLFLIVSKPRLVLQILKVFEGRSGTQRGHEEGISIRKVDRTGDGICMRSD